ncbi:MAG: DUF748 domain-containing protein [Bacteroidota bacterium]
MKADNSNQPTKKNKRKKLRIILTILALLVIIRLILPYIVLHYANKALANINGYYGHIEDIDLAIYRGAYKIKDLYLNKIDSVSNEETEFFDTRIIDLSVHWKELWKGKIVGELELTDPSLRFTKDKVEPAELQKDTSDFRALLDDFMPLRINRFEIINGQIQYIDNNSSPNVNIKMTETYILAENLTTDKNDTSLLPANVKASANVYNGTLNFGMKLNPLADHPTFDLNAELKATELPKLNNFFKAYGKFDVNKGTFGMYTEIAAEQGKFVGYVKPVINNLDVLGQEDRDDKLGQKFWEGIVGAAGVIFKNQKHDQVATKIPLQGTFDKAKVDLWYTILDILRNAFIKALQPAIDKEINIGTVKNLPTEEEKKGFFKKIFNGSKDDKEESRKEK